MNVGIALSEEFNSLRLLQIVTSVALAAVIDSDHMIEARSLSIKVYMTLSNDGCLVYSFYLHTECISLGVLLLISKYHTIVLCIHTFY